MPLSVTKKLERISSNFLWNNKMQAWSWAGMQDKKGRGPWHQKDIGYKCCCWYQAVLETCTSQSLRAKWMQNKYLKNQPLNSATVFSLDSGA